MSGRASSGMPRAGSTVVVKVGSSSVSLPGGGVDREAIRSIVDSVASAHKQGVSVCLVSSGAIAAGIPTLGLRRRPDNLVELQVLAAVGQTKLMQAYSEAFGYHGLMVGQVLLTALDFSDRRHYLNARSALQRMLEMGVVPIVNENDTVATDEIRFGDNDRLGALVAQLVSASLYLVLTDTEGLYTTDPRLDESATLLEEVRAFDAEMIRYAGGPGTEVGSGGMLSKLLATRIAAWSGIPSIIAYARTEDVVMRAVRGERLGTEVKAHTPGLPARKAWIAFGAFPAGKIEVDEGALRALKEKGASLLPVGVRKVEGDFEAGDAVEVCFGGQVVAKGISRISAEEVRSRAGKRSAELGGAAEEVIHRDDLVVFPDA